MHNAINICTIGKKTYDIVENWYNLSNNSNYVFSKIVDCTNFDELKDGFKYTEQDIRDNFKFNFNVSKKHYWNSEGNRNIVWFYAHFRMLNFYLKHPYFDYYWFFDDDVKIDDWEKFLIEVDKDYSDFISYFIFKGKDIKEYEHIPTIDSKTTSDTVWFERFPGDQDNLPENIDNIFGSFFPINRYSNSAMKYLYELTLKGYHGYGEGFVPTVLANKGFSITSLYDKLHNSNLFDTSNKILHKNSIIKWEWI